MFLSNLKIIALSFLALAALAISFGAQAAAEELPPLVAKLYPGAVAGATDEGKIIQCGGNQVDYHKPYCFLTKDSIDKVREYYARAGIKLEPIQFKKGQNTEGDSLYNLAEAASIQLNREEIGSIYAAPVEYVETKSAADEPSYFNTLIVMSGKGKQKLQGTAQANKAVILENPIFSIFALTPESTPNVVGGLMVDPELLIPIYNKHIALQGSFFTMGWFEINHKKLIVKRMTDSFADQMKENREKSDQRKAERKNMTPEMRMQLRSERAADREKKRAQRDVDRKNNVVKKAAPADSEDWGPQADRAKVIDAFLDEMDREAYPTMIMIQRSATSGVTRNPAIMQKEWRRALAPL